MTQKSFNILEFCTTMIREDCFGIFQDQYIGRFVDDVPESLNLFCKGIWVYYIASVNIIAYNYGYIADETIQVDAHKFVYLYQLL